MVSLRNLARSRSCLLSRLSFVVWFGYFWRIQSQVDLHVCLFNLVGELLPFYQLFYGQFAGLSRANRGRLVGF
jgi:hypothetical protein